MVRKNGKLTQDHSFILIGSSQSNISGDKTEDSQGGYDCWIIKIDSAGNVLWQNTIGGSGDDKIYCVHQTIDGYIIGGSSQSNISGDKIENSFGGYDYWILKLDTNGNIIWQKTIGGAANDALFSIQETTDGGYFLGGYSNSDISGLKTENSMGGYDYWAVELDSSRNILWQNTLGGGGDEIFSSGLQTNDGGYLIGGYSNSDSSSDKSENKIGGNDYWVVKLDSMGSIEWENTIGGTAWDILESVIQCSDGGYLIGGYSGSNISSDKTENCHGIEYDYWIIKLYSLATGIGQNYSDTKNILVYPNPVRNNLTIELSMTIGNAVIEIFNSLGNKIHSENFSGNSKKLEVDLSNGIYFLQVTDGQQFLQKKFIVED